MGKMFILSDNKSKLEYIKLSAPSIYENILSKLEINDEYDFKSRILIEKTVFEAFELSGNQAIITTDAYEISAIKKVLTKEQKITVNGAYKIIDDMCFSNCSNLETIVFEEGVECIKERVLYGCLTLKTVIFPTTLNYIGGSAFENCNELDNVAFGNPETWISPNAFERTKWFERFTEDFIVINGQLLKYNGKEKNLKIPEGVAHISHQVFCDNEDIETIICPSTLRGIWTYAFSNCVNLKKIVLNNGLKHICIAAFENCTNLKEVVLPKSLEELGAMAFDRNTCITFYDIHKALTKHIKEIYPQHKMLK